MRTRVEGILLSNNGAPRPDDGTQHLRARMEPSLKKSSLGLGCVTSHGKLRFILGEVVRETSLKDAPVIERLGCRVLCGSWPPNNPTGSLAGVRERLIHARERLMHPHP